MESAKPIRGHIAPEGEGEEGKQSGSTMKREAKSNSFDPRDPYRYQGTSIEDGSIQEMGGNSNSVYQEPFASSRHAIEKTACWRTNEY